MKVNGNFLKKAFAAAALVLTPCLAQAAYNSGSTGADGAFSPTATSAIQVPESGVFNFTTVNIPTGVTISFIKNSLNTPVTILASGDVTIAGTVTLDGGNASTQFGGNSGPGGFAGGNGGAPGKNGFRGEGPGGGGGGIYGGGTTSGGGGGAGYGLDGYVGYSVSPSTTGVKGTLYGNVQILPLMGGSGGGGGSGYSSASGGGGGGGGGAILIASSGTITVSGLITAKGGNGADGESSYGGGGGAGSGGGIRLVCESLAGNGAISATFGTRGNSTSSRGGNSTEGRIRLEYNSKTRSAVTTPSYTYGAPAPVVPSSTATLTIQSIGGADVPATSQGLMSAPDVNLPWGTANPLNIVVKGANIPVGTTITIKASPSVGTAVTATGTLAGTDADSSVTIPISIATAYPSVITATCTYTVIASNGAPIYAGGERVEKIRVASVVGGASSITYITESGREIPVVM